MTETTTPSTTSVLADMRHAVARARNASKYDDAEAQSEAEQEAAQAAATLDDLMSNGAPLPAPWRPSSDVLNPLRAWGYEPVSDDRIGDAISAVRTLLGIPEDDHGCGTCWGGLVHGAIYPANQTPGQVQRCDDCATFADDEQAAFAVAHHLGGSLAFEFEEDGGHDADGGPVGRWYVELDGEREHP